MFAPPRSQPMSQPWGVWFSTSSSTRLPRHRHEYGELNLILSGSLAYRLDESSPALEARAGQLVAIPSGLSHELVQTSDDLALWVVELKGTEPPAWLTEAALLAPTERWRKAALGVLRKLWLRPSVQDALELQARFWDALRSVERTPVSRALELHPAVMQAKAVCEQAGEQKLDIASLARQSGLSAGRLAHLFADQLGVTPLQYRNFAHVQRFIQSYDGDERDLLGAALRAGFGSYAQFHRAFRQVCGESPAVHFKWLATNARLDAKRKLASAPLSPLEA